ncbi:MAG: discoidin domain-containing protein [Acidobacteriota bacterium]
MSSIATQGNSTLRNRDVASQHTNVTVHYTPGQPLNRFAPSHAFGAAIDGHEKGELDRMLSAQNIREMLTAGLKPISYRLRTELAGEAWHWNPRGRWSERKRNEGYWTSNGDNGPIALSYGYRLPRRGNTIDQANEDGYSRLDDGDARSFWKSNPYLDQHFSGEPNSNLQQWLMIDFGTSQNINAIRLLWSEPYATVYEVQYGRYAGEDDISASLPDIWQTFPLGSIQQGKGGAVTLRLAKEPITTRFVRVLLKESSGTSKRTTKNPVAHGRTRDIRDRLGYAVREIYAGTIDSDGSLYDEVSHAPNKKRQTAIYVSSTDPWHRASDKDELIEQIGFDRIYASGLTNGMSMLVPVPVLYDTPENAAAELRYLKAHGFPVDRIELGEEPDGQFVTPEDFAALYIQFAKALHAVDPKIQLGGPSFQDIAPGEQIGSIKTGKPEWLRRFLDYLKQHGRLDDYTFTSFEWYPVDDVCKPTAPQLAEATGLLSTSLDQMRAAGSAKPVPWIITELGYSAFGARAEMDLAGALLNADAVGNFLSHGGEQTFLYGYEPNEVLEEEPCSAGNNMLFLIRADGKIAFRMPTFYGAELLTREWTKPGNDMHELYPATVDDALVSAYPLLRPDGLWSVMLVNKDPERSRMVQVKFRNDTNGLESTFTGKIDLYQYSPKQYQLNADLHNPHPLVDLPPEHAAFDAARVVELSPYSITIVRGIL